MIKLIAMVRRLESLSHEEFRDYYETRHRLLVAHFAHCIEDYRRSYPRPDLAAIAGIYTDPADAGATFDVMTEIWFKDVESLWQAFDILGSPEVRPIFEADEGRFMDRKSIRVTICDETGDPEELAAARRSRPAAQAFPIETLTSPS